MKITASAIVDAKACLRASGWLSRCPTPFAEALLAKLQWMTADPEEQIARGGEADSAMFGLASGSAGIVPAIAAADVGLILIASAPFWFGLQPFATGEGRQISVLARQKCLVGRIDKQALSQILKDHPDGWRMLLMQVTESSALAVQGVADLLLTDRYRRCGAVLLRLAGARNPGSTPQEVFCTHEELGDLCNLSRTSVGNILGRFESQQLLKTGYRSLRVIDANRLRSLVDAS